MPHNRIATRTFVVAAVAALLLAAGAALLQDAPPAPAHAAPPGAPPQNDNVAAALPLSPFMMPEVDTRSTAAATLESGEPRPCGNIGRTVWYVWGAAPESRTVQLDTSGSDFDNVIAIYRVNSAAPADVGKLSPVLCKDELHGSAEVLNFDAQAGQIYAVQVGGHNGAGGALQLRADCVPAGCPPANDDLAQAQDLSAPWALPGAFEAETHGATLEPGEPQPCGAMGKTAWYEVGGTDTRLQFEATAGFPVVMALYEGPAGATSSAQLRHFKCSLRAGDAASVVWDAQPGHVYYLQAGGQGDAGGNLTIDGECPLGCSTPANDALVNATWLGGDSADADLVGSGLEPGEPQPCGSISNSVWYFIPTFGQDAHVAATASGGFQVELSAYTAQPEDAASPARLRAAGCGRNVLDLRLVDGFLGYLVQVSGADGAAGPVHITVAHTRAPALPANVHLVSGQVTLPNTGSGGYLPGARR